MLFVKILLNVHIADIAVSIEATGSPCPFRRPEIRKSSNVVEVSAVSACGSCAFLFAIAILLLVGYGGKPTLLT